MKLVLVALIASTMSTCNGPLSEAKRNGGSYTIDLPAGQKFMNSTWKRPYGGDGAGDEIWYISRPMRENETAETYTFTGIDDNQKSLGKVIFKETK